MATKTSELAREVESLRDRMDQVEDRVLFAPLRPPVAPPVLGEVFAPRLASIPQVIGAALEEEADGWTVITFLEGWDDSAERAVYAAEWAALRSPIAAPIHFQLRPRATAESFAAEARKMTVLYRRD